MKTIIFREDIEPEATQSLIDDIEQPHEEAKEHNIKILFSSPGGQMDMAQAIVDCINGLSDEFDVELVVTYQALSAGFDIFVKTKCKKTLYSTAHGLVHLYTRDLSVRNIINNKKSYDRFLLDEMNNRNAEYLEWLESLKIFTKKELKRVSRGGDVYVERERLQKIIDNQNKK